VWLIALIGWGFVLVRRTWFRLFVTVACVTVGHTLLYIGMFVRAGLAGLPMNSEDAYRASAHMLGSSILNIVFFVCVGAAIVTVEKLCPPDSAEASNVS
jgi:hypothetical protein